MHAVTMLFVSDVEATSAWYQSVLGVVSGHGGDEFDMLLAGDNVIMQLHKIDDDHHDHSVNLEGPLVRGKSSFYLSGRRSYIDLLRNPNKACIRRCCRLGWCCCQIYTQRMRRGYMLH